MAKKITKQTIKWLRTAASQFFPDDEVYHVWLGRQYGVESTLELSNAQGREAAKAINQMAKRETSDVRRLRPGGISLKQEAFISSLFSQLGIPAGKRQVGYIKKQIGTPKAVSWLSAKEASKIITGLNRWNRQKARSKN